MAFHSFVIIGQYIVTVDILISVISKGWFQDTMVYHTSNKSHLAHDFLIISTSKTVLDKAFDLHLKISTNTCVWKVGLHKEDINNSKFERKLWQKRSKVK